MKAKRSLLVIAAICLLTSGFVWAADPTAELDKLEKRVKMATANVRKKLPPSARGAFDAGADFDTPDHFVQQIGPQIKELQNVLGGVERLRNQLTKASATPNDPRFSRLDQLQRQVERVLGGPERFQSGAKWAGSIQLNGTAHKLELEIKQSDGNSFSGELAEIERANRPARMKIGGSIDGNSISMKTGDMILGQPRERTCNGSVFRNRIVGEVTALDKQNKKLVPSVGTLELTFNAAKQ